MDEEHKENNLHKVTQERLSFIFKEMKRTRNEKKISILHVSMVSGIGYGYISLVENEKQKNVGMGTIMRYCVAIDEDFIALITRAEVNYQIHKRTQES